MESNNTKYVVDNSSTKYYASIEEDGQIIIYTPGKKAPVIKKTKEELIKEIKILQSDMYNDMREVINSERHINNCFYRFTHIVSYLKELYESYSIDCQNFPEYKKLIELKDLLWQSFDGTRKDGSYCQYSEYCQLPYDQQKSLKKDYNKFNKLTDEMIDVGKYLIDNSSLFKVESLEWDNLMNALSKEFEKKNEDGTPLHDENKINVLKGVIDNILNKHIETQNAIFNYKNKIVDKNDLLNPHNNNDFTLSETLDVFENQCLETSTSK